MTKTNSRSAHTESDAETNVSGHGSATRSSVTLQMIEKRASELAEISGRGSDNVIEADRLQARKELLGSATADDPADDSGIVPSGMGAPPTATGTHTKNHLPTDDQVEIQTVQEGVDEAEHSTMLEAVRRKPRPDE